MSDLTFTEAEVKATADFVQFFYDKATFKDMSVKDAMAVPRHLKHMNDLIKRMDDHIFEFKKVIPPAKKKAKAKKDAK